MSTKFYNIITTLVLVILISYETTNAQSLFINWGKEQPYHKRGETKNIELIRYNQQSVFYKVTTDKLNSKLEFIVKHNRITGENKYFDITNDLYSSEIVFNTVEIVNGDLKVVSEIFFPKNSEVRRFQQFVDTTTLLAKGEPVEFFNDEKKIVYPTP